MDYLVSAYACYLLLSVGATMWVGMTLRRNGPKFIGNDDAEQADTVDALTHLLVVGFYLVNFGMICLALKYGDDARDIRTLIELVSTKVGIVLVVLGFMHFLILASLAAARRRNLYDRNTRNVGKWRENPVH